MPKEESRWEEKNVEIKRMTDGIKNKCYIGIRGVYTTIPNRYSFFASDF